VRQGRGRHGRVCQAGKVGDIQSTNKILPGVS